MLLSRSMCAGIALLAALLLAMLQLNLSYQNTFIGALRPFTARPSQVSGNAAAKTIKEKKGYASSDRYRL